MRSSPGGLIVDAWLAELFQPFISSTLAYEYRDVLSRKLAPKRWMKARSVLRLLLEKATYTTVYYTWRPASPDESDDMVIDCAMNANAILVTANVKDFRMAEKELGLNVMAPVAFLHFLAD